MRRAERGTPGVETTDSCKFIELVKQEGLVDVTRVSHNPGLIHWVFGNVRVNVDRLVDGMVAAGFSATRRDAAVTMGAMLRAGPPPQVEIREAMEFLRSLHEHGATLDADKLFVADMDERYPTSAPAWRHAFEVLKAKDRHG